MDMDAAEMRARRKTLGLTQDELAARLDLTRGYVSRMEKGAAPIAPRTAAALRALKPARERAKARSTDPMERLIEDALIEAGVRYVTDYGGGTAHLHNLDFHLLDYDIAIEVKLLHTPRIAAQMERTQNVIVAQGEVAVRFLAAAIRSGDFFAVPRTSVAMT